MWPAPPPVVLWMLRMLPCDHVDVAFGRIPPLPPVVWWILHMVCSPPTLPVVMSMLRRLRVALSVVTWTMSKLLPAPLWSVDVTHPLPPASMARLCFRGCDGRVLTACGSSCYGRSCCCNLLPLLLLQLLLPLLLLVL